MSFFNRKQFFLFLIIFAATRLFSFWFSSNTPLWPAHWLNEFVAITYLLFTAYCLIKKYPLGWYLVAGEIILGGGGGYFSFAGVSLRTLLLIVSIPIYGFQQLKQRLSATGGSHARGRRSAFGGEIWALLIVAGFSSIIGLSSQHNVKNILSDLIPYCFLLYYFPLKKLIADDKFKKNCFNLLAAAIVGNFLLVAFTFIGYNIGAFAIHDNFYWWWRAVAGGKVTALPFDYYRIVLNEHLLLAPLILWGFYKLITDNKNYLIWTLSALLLLILSINLTRAYILAIAVGALVLFSRAHWKQWLLTGVTFVAIFILGFSSIHLIASRGQSFGFDLLFGRIKSIVLPQTEDSSLSRLILLPKILEKIKSAPIIGSGLGDTVTAYSPTFKSEITTPHFDWGYLEIWAEMGLVGLFAWGLFLWKIIKNNLKKPLILSMLAALMVINITSPALFHVMGIIFLVTLVCHSERAERVEESLISS